MGMTAQRLRLGGEPPVQRVAIPDPTDLADILAALAELSAVLTLGHSGTTFLVRAGELDLIAHALRQYGTRLLAREYNEGLGRDGE